MRDIEIKIDQPKWYWTCHGDKAYLHDTRIDCSELPYTLSTLLQCVENVEKNRGFYVTHEAYDREHEKFLAGLDALKTHLAVKGFESILKLQFIQESVPQFQEPKPFTRVVDEDAIEMLRMVFE